MSKMIRSVRKPNRQAQATALAFVLIVLYSLPLYLGLVSLIASDGMQESSRTAAWFSAYLKSSDSTLSEFHKILMPAISAISVAAYSKRNTTGMLLLAGYVLLAFFVAVWTTVWFDLSSVQNGLNGLGDGLKAEDAKTYLGRIRETLLMYFMMLVGLKVADAPKQEPNS